MATKSHDGKWVCLRCDIEVGGPWEHGGQDCPNFVPIRRTSCFAMDYGIGDGALPGMVKAIKEDKLDMEVIPFTQAIDEFQRDV